MPSLQFAANISCMYKEAARLEDRYDLAKVAGFKAVECTYPYEVPLEVLVARKEASRLEHVHMNSYPGDLRAGDGGIAALPDRTMEFRDTLEMSIKYAKALKCPRMRIMSGRCNPNLMMAEMEVTLLENLKYAVPRLQEEGIVGMLENVNSLWTIPDYYLDTVDKAMKFVSSIDSPYLRLQLDIYHLQIMSGNVTRRLEQYIPYTEHIQVAQAPDRGQLDSPGELNYRYILEKLDCLGYDKWVGLEYSPTGSTADGLGWLNDWGYTL